VDYTTSFPQNDISAFEKFSSEVIRLSNDTILMPKPWTSIIFSLHPKLFTEMAYHVAANDVKGAERSGAEVGTSQEAETLGCKAGTSTVQLSKVWATVHVDHHWNP
jgi:hypothetical protein